MGSPGTGRPQLGSGRQWGLPGRCPHLTPGAQSTSPCPWDPRALLRAQRFPGLGAQCSWAEQGGGAVPIAGVFGTRG